uniref:Uncharacterized protein n=1 Tax=Rhizophora mucronata TaxID=61149 RepID=A0A2P2K5Z5_RHIMU
MGVWILYVCYLAERTLTQSSFSFLFFFFLTIPSYIWPSFRSLFLFLFLLLCLSLEDGLSTPPPETVSQKSRSLLIELAFSQVLRLLGLPGAWFC